MRKHLVWFLLVPSFAASLLLSLFSIPSLHYESCCGSDPVTDVIVFTGLGTVTSSAILFFITSRFLRSWLALINQKTEREETGLNESQPLFVNEWQAPAWMILILLVLIPGLWWFAFLFRADSLNPRLSVLRNCTLQKFKAISLAVDAYVADHGRRIVSQLEEKSVSHPISWRVLILPYMNETELFLKYRTDEPWDSPRNSALLNEMPDVFRDSCLCQQDAGLTHVFSSSLLDDFMQGKSSTSRQDPAEIVVFESAGTGMEWTRPEMGFDFEEMKRKMTQGSDDKKPRCVMTDDLFVKFVSPDLSDD